MARLLNSFLAFNQLVSRLKLNLAQYGDMAELVDAPDLGSGPARGDGFESLYPHQLLV